MSEMIVLDILFLSAFVAIIAISLFLNRYEGNFYGE